VCSIDEYFIQQQARLKHEKAIKKTHGRPKIEDTVSLYNIQSLTGSQSQINWSTELCLWQKPYQPEYIVYTSTINKT
jgi:hypothetical protein